MIIDTNTMISITDANQNFSKVAKVVDEHGTEEKVASSEDVFSISERLIRQNMEAYEVLAK